MGWSQPTEQSAAIARFRHETPRNGNKTPANSLHAAIQREIKTKGAASRFVKAERGKFALAAKS